jgi:hypothetical protein
VLRFASALLVLAGCDFTATPAQPIDASGAGNDALGSPPPPDALRMADLQLVPARMGPPSVVDQTFVNSDCEVVEQCVGGTGPRKLLTVDTITANLGTADLALGAPPADGVSNDIFEWSACYGRHHVRDYAAFELIDSAGHVAVGHKAAFCLEDDQVLTIGALSHGYTCANQGISPGWTDVYGHALWCQWIDITGLPSGNYTLRMTINPAHRLPESDYTNNVFTTQVTL